MCSYIGDIYLINLKLKNNCLHLHRFPLNFSCTKETI